MMEGILARACRAADERKAAVMGVQADDCQLGQLDGPACLLLLSGLGVDPDEAAEITTRAGQTWFQIVMQGLWAPPDLATRAVWFDGLLVGAMLGQIAERESHEIDATADE